MASENPNILDNHLKEHRSKLGISQTELGKLAGVSRQTISLIERKRSDPSIIVALKLAKIFHVPVGDIFEIQKYAKGKK